MIKVQVFNFNKNNFANLSKGKKTTIRLGYKDYRLGHAKLICEDSGTEYDSEVIEIRVVRFGDLGLQEANSDGFNTIEILRNELERCYKKYISDLDVVTLVRFKM